MPPDAASPARRPLLDRALGLLLLTPAVTVLAFALRLPPSPTGVGTHRQLGLGGCTLLQLTGLPCPMCGMTTTFALAVRGRLLDALLCQPFGLALFLLTVAAAVVSALELIAPRGRLRRAWDWLGFKEGWVAGALLAGLLAGWCWKLIAMRS